MKLPLKWLSEYVDITGIDTKKYCDRMTDTGSKVEKFEILAQDIENVLVGRITSIKKHENSDKLQICMLNVGKDEEIQIVTGAQNVFEGAIVPAAIAPAKLPGGVVIKAGKLRGEASNGMLCSIAELNLTLNDMSNVEADGILILEESFAEYIGKDIREALLLSDTVVEFEITSNRPDCLSVIGLARETAVSFDREFVGRTPVVKKSNDTDTIENYLSVKISAPELCHRYTARVVKNVKIAPSPLWLRMRLKAAGVRPINNIVDITNYVMLEYGQPMHAFDYSCLSGNAIDVRRAANGETFKALDDTMHTLDSETLVIADSEKAVALAGVMGGANSEITNETKTVVFESANFFGTAVRIAAKKQGMRTESSGRFEKGLDPENTVPAVERALELVQLLQAGEVVNGMIDLYPTKGKVRTVTLNKERVNKFLGTQISDVYMLSVLNRLGFTVDGDVVTAPSFRSDIEYMNDIAEEIVRIYGYNNIKSSNIIAEMTQGKRTEKQSFDRNLHSLLVGMGLYEVKTFSFISPKYYDKIGLPKDDARHNSVVITNPLGEDTSVMRTTAVPSMLEVLARNYNFKNESVGLYEIATVYIPNGADELPNENKTVIIGMYGNGNCDFYSLKGAVENVLDYSGISGVSYKSDSSNPTFHPGRCAVVMSSEGKRIATIGQIHPSVAAAYDIATEVYVAEIDLELIYNIKNLKKEYKQLPKFPSMTRDFSFVCEDELEAGTIEAAIRETNTKLLEDIKVFDVYRSEKIGANKKSVSVRITLRAQDRTLTLEEADKTAQKLLKTLGEKLGIAIRNQ